MRTKHIIVLGLASAIAVLPTTPAHGGSPVRARGAGQLRDLLPLTAQPTDHATAQVVAYESAGHTIVRLKVQGLAHGAAGHTLGAHIHVGPCVEGNGGLAGLHYNSTGNAQPATSTTEVWLDFVVGSNGTGRAEADVPFVIPTGGAGSLVIHRDATNAEPPPSLDAGKAGPRWACLPVQF